VESFILFFQGLDPLLVCVLLFLLAFVENLFPPSPSDVMIVVGGTLVGMDKLGFLPALLSATAGSVAGFVVMYKIGDWFGDHILEQGKIRFIKIETVHKVEGWFRDHGYWIIVINRFLTGTRAVVSFFAGMSEMKLGLTTLLCAVSALAWNAVLVSLGMFVGQNFSEINGYIQTYSRIVTIVVIVVTLFFIGRFIWKRRMAART
jgi:membrane protein DedA with SNARE-associated domain